MAVKDKNSVYLDHAIWRLKPGLKELSKKDIAYYKKTQRRPSDHHQ